MSERAFLDREQILAHEDRPWSALQVPEWGGQWVRVGTWSLTTQWRIAQASQEGNARGVLLALVAALSIVDAKGVRLFADEDVARLADEKNYRALERIATAAMKWNGLEAGAVDALGKGSEPTPIDGSSSASPSPSA